MRINQTFRFLVVNLLLLTALSSCNKDNIVSTTETGTEPTTLTGGDTIAVVFSSSSDATVSGASSSQSVSIDGNGVTIVNNSRTSIIYLLSGSTANGFLKIYSPKKQQIELCGVSITNPNGAAINVQGITDSVSKGKTVYLVLNGSNELSDGTTYTNTPDGEDEKAALFSEGQIIISGTGSLTVTAKGKSGIASDDYVDITGGTVTVNCTASTFVSGGDTTKVAGIKTNDAFTMADGILNVTCSGAGAKGLSGDGTALFGGGEVNITVTGSNFGSSGNSGQGGGPGGHGGGPGGGNSSDNSVAAKGMKFDGNIVFNGGTVTVKSTNHEAVESKSALTINGGHLFCYSSSDDAINAAGELTINDGYVYAQSVGNDGIDANGNLYVNGGLVYAIGSSGAEQALDANTEGGAKLYVSGGTLIAIGGLESGASLTQSCYQASTWSQNTWYALTVGGITYAFKTPSSGGSPLVVSGSSSSEPSLSRGVTATGGTSYFDGLLLEGANVTGGTSVSLNSYTGSGGGWH
ncbi:MAG: carbohydrate-binding domain-containing protein [Bacteroidales bacterium]|nr:carbohydrate-binding domain-containing protein [Bacteroidales bacterium]